MEQATHKSAFLKSFHQWPTKLHYNCHTMNIWCHSEAGSLLPKSSNGFRYAGLRISGCGHTLLTSLKNQSSVSSVAKVAVVPDTEVPGKRDSQLEGANPIFLLVCEVKGTELFCFKQLSVSQFCCAIFSQRDVKKCLLIPNKETDQRVFPQSPTLGANELISVVYRTWVKDYVQECR